VRSFAEHWHFISGGMEEQDEGDVVRRCWKELEEEVRLSWTSEDILPCPKYSSKMHYMKKWESGIQGLEGTDII
jgi:hypothetical protein